MIKLTEKNGRISVETPYNAEFVREMKSNIGSRKWNAESKTWNVSADDKDALLKILNDIFGYSEDQGGKTCTVENKFNKEDYADKGAIMIAGIVIAKAYGRDSGATVADAVTVLDGGFTSGGSRANWETKVKEGTVIRVKDFPEWALDGNLKANIDIDDIEIKKVSESKFDREKLLEEKENLLKRLAEIEELLEHDENK